MSAHGRHGRAGAVAPVRRVGPFTLETLLVLALIFAITGGSYVMSEVRPVVREQKVVVGGKTVKVTQVGAGGVQPGVLEPRVIPVAAPTVTATPTAKPAKPIKVKPTPTPTVDAPPAPGPIGGPILPGGSGGEGENCTLGLLCSAEPEATPAPEETGGTEVTEPVEPPAEDPVAEPTPKKKKKAPAEDPPPAE